MASGVSGLNDETDRPVIQGTCSGCQNTSNVGTSSVPRLFNLGLADVSPRTADLPVYTLRNRRTGKVARTTDPGQALVTGRWKDLGRFQVPGLRGLAARAPYFHNGGAETLRDVAEFYDRRFGMALSPREKDDLVAFLRSL